MDLREYFESTAGLGILSTADQEGNVDAAIYAKPHVTVDGNIAFIMNDSVTYSNITQNPQACYLFKEEGQAYTGKRLYLQKISETENTDQIIGLQKKCHCLCDEDKNKKRFLVYFAIIKERHIIHSTDV